MFWGTRDELSGLLGAGVPEELRRLLVVLAGNDLVDLLLQMAVGGEHVQPAVEVVVEEEHAELQLQAGLRPQAVRRTTSSSNSRLFAGSPCETKKLVGSLAKLPMTTATALSLRGRADVDAHRAAGRAVAAEGDARLAADFLELAVLLIVEDEVLDRVVGHDEVLPAVAVEIERHDAQGLAGGNLLLGLLALKTWMPAASRDVAELAVAVVAIQVAERPLEAERRTVRPLVAGQREALG